MSSKSIVLVVLPIEFCRESRRFHLEFCRKSRCFRVKFSTLKIPVVSKLRLFTGLSDPVQISQICHGKSTLSQPFSVTNLGNPDRVWSCPDFANSWREGEEGKKEGSTKRISMGLDKKNVKCHLTTAGNPKCHAFMLVCCHSVILVSFILLC